MFEFIKNMYIGLLTSLNNQQCMTQPALTNLHPNEYSQGIRCYPFAVNLEEMCWEL